MTPPERTDAQIAIVLRDWLERGVEALPDGMDLPAPVRDQIITQLPTTSQRRRWWSGRWSTRGRGAMRSDDVPGDRESRRSNRMNGFAALLAAGAIGGAAVLAGVSQQDQGGRTIVVAQDGSGDATTITEGVALAVDGDTVLIRPGVYGESPVVRAAITITGDGPREAIVVEGTLGVEGATSSEGPYSFVLVESDMTLSNLTIRGMAGLVIIHGGSPTLTGLLVEGTGVPYGSTAPCTDERGCSYTLLVNDGSTATIRDNLFVGGADLVVDGDADPVIEGNELRDGPHFYLADPGDTAVVRDNTISGTFDRGIGIFGKSTMLIEDNRITDAGGDGITIGWNTSVGIDPQVRGNIITGSGVAINVQSQAHPRLESNVLIENKNGIMSADPDAVIIGNTVRGGGFGVSLARNGSPTIEGNDIERTKIGVMLTAGSDASVTGNRFCDNGQDLLVGGKTEPLPSGNSTCGTRESPIP